MPQPVALTNEEFEILNRLAAPIAFGQREKFLAQVAAALVAYPERGPGALHRAAREIQKGFTLEAQRQTETGDKPRHIRAFARLRV